MAEVVLIAKRTLEDALLQTDTNNPGMCARHEAVFAGLVASRIYGRLDIHVSVGDVYSAAWTHFPELYTQMSSESSLVLIINSLRESMSSSSTQPEGLYAKFNVSRNDGRDKPGGDRANARYYVLDLTYCPHAPIAAYMYAKEIDKAGYTDTALDMYAELRQYPQVAQYAERENLLDKKGHEAAARIAELEKLLAERDAVIAELAELSKREAPVVPLDVIVYVVLDSSEHFHAAYSTREVAEKVADTISGKAVVPTAVDVPKCLKNISDKLSVVERFVQTTFGKFHED